VERHVRPAALQPAFAPRRPRVVSSLRAPPDAAAAAAALADYRAQILPDFRRGAGHGAGPPGRGPGPADSEVAGVVESAAALVGALTRDALSRAKPRAGQEPWGERRERAERLLEARRAAPMGWAGLSEVRGSCELYVYVY
jgi:hypothetical protein